MEHDTPEHDTPEGGIDEALANKLLLSALGSGHDRSESYRRLREVAPVLRTRTGDLVLSLYADCDAALRDERLSVVMRAAPADGSRAATGRSRFWDMESEDPDVAQWYRHNLLFKDPPDHTRLRALLRSALTARDWQHMEPKVVAAANRCVADFGRANGGDFVHDVAIRLPLTVLAELLGVPEADRASVSPLIIDLAAILRPYADVPTLERAYQARADLIAYLGHLLLQKKERPEDDLISRLLRVEEGGDLTAEETMGILILMLAAGLDTTTCMLGNGMLALLKNPAQLELLRRQPDLVPSAINEMLRYDPPAQSIRRAISGPVEFGGVAADEGHFAILLLASANRDPLRFTTPDQFDVERDEGGNLSFSAGVHRCLGAPLAVMEAEAAFRALMSFETIELAGTVSCRTLDLKGPTSVPLRVV